MSRATVAASAHRYARLAGGSDEGLDTPSPMGSPTSDISPLTDDSINQENAFNIEEYDEEEKDEAFLEETKDERYNFHIEH